MRSLAAQIQDIADWISAIDLDPKPTMDSFSAGAMSAAWAAISYLAYDGNEYSYRERCLAYIKPVLAGFPNGEQLYNRITRAHPSTEHRPFPSLLEIADTLRPVQWAWPNWLPIGMLTLLAARPGTGKSLVALDLAHRIIAGDPWPDGTPMTRPGASVIYVDGENVPQILNERAASWQMDRGNIYLLLPDEDDIILDLSQPRYQDKLAEMAYRLEPALIVIDSLGSIMGKGENAIEDVRQILAYLARLGAQNGAAILLIHHLRKASSGQMSLIDSVDPDMIRGSSHITAMARVAWGLTAVQTGPDPDRNGPRKLEVIKSNLSRYPDPLGITLEPLPDGDAVKPVYALEAPTRYQETTVVDEAGSWLVGYLADAGAPVKPSDVVAAAAAEGYSRATIYRARELLDQVVNTKGRKSRGNCWALPSTVGAAPPDSDDSTEETV
jgi:KaiC/GvpD/RAD55 family RecA-like ATPase